MNTQLTFTYRLPSHPDEPTNSYCKQFCFEHEFKTLETVGSNAPALSVFIGEGLSDADTIKLLEQVIYAIKESGDIAELYDFFAEGV